MSGPPAECEDGDGRLILRDRGRKAVFTAETAETGEEDEGKINHKGTKDTKKTEDREEFF
jgi:hypothetical protein